MAPQGREGKYIKWLIIRIVTHFFRKINNIRLSSGSIALPSYREFSYTSDYFPDITIMDSKVSGEIQKAYHDQAKGVNSIFEFSISYHQRMII